jgi:hypothetical protein
MEGPAPTPALQADPQKRPRMSLAARLLNVFAVPGEVFGELKNSPPSFSNWLVPSLFMSVVGIISVCIMFSTPAIQDQFRNKQTKLIEERAKAAKMTEEEQRLAEKFANPAVLKAVGGAGAVIGTFLSVLWWGLVLRWLAARMLKVQVPFPKALEVSGLATMINVLGGLVAVLLMIKIGHMGATPSLALVIKDFDTTRKGHLFAAAANIFSFWVVGVRSIGLAKLTNVTYLRAAWLVLSFWLLQQSILVISGLGQLAM